MSDASAQSRSVSDIVRRWADQDPIAAGSSINVMPAGPARGAAVPAFASAVSPTDVQAAVGWAPKHRRRECADLGVAASRPSRPLAQSDERSGQSAERRGSAGDFAKSSAAAAVISVSLHGCSTSSGARQALPETIEGYRVLVEMSGEIRPLNEAGKPPSANRTRPTLS